MPNNVFTTTLGITFLFLVTGALQLGFSLIVQSQQDDRPQDGPEAVRNLLFQMFPLTAGIVNGAFIMATTAFTVLGLMSPARGLLKAAGYMVTVCGLFTLCLGVYMWIMTLRLKDGFFPTYIEQDGAVQSLMQQSVSLPHLLPSPLLCFSLSVSLSLPPSCQKEYDKTNAGRSG